MQGDVMSDRGRLIGALSLVYVIWGSTYLAIRFAVETLPPLSMASVRFLLAGALLLAWTRWRGHAFPTLRQWRSSAIIGVLLLLGGNGAVVTAQQWVASGLAALLVAVEPMFVVLVDWIRPGGRRPTALVAIGLVVGFAGTVVLVDPASLTGGDRNALGAMLVVVAALSWAIGSVYAQRAELPSSALVASAANMLCGGLALGILGGARGEWTTFDPSAVTTKSLLAVAYLLVFGSLIAFSAYSWLVRAAPPALVATYAYVNPVVAVFLGWAFAGETFESKTLLAGLLVLIAVALISLGRDGGGLPWRRRRRHPPVIASPNPIVPLELDTATELVPEVGETNRAA
jgi:drug/metabolite transporter (DMT)-like permease